MGLNISIKSLLAAATFSLLTKAVSVPGCQTVAPPQTTLYNVTTASVGVPGSPFGLLYAPQKDIAFATLGATLGVLNTSDLTPSLIRQISLPTGYQPAAGLALAYSGRHVFIAGGAGAVIVDVQRAINGSSDAVVGTLNGTTESQTPGKEAIEVTISKDDYYAFVSQEYGPNLGITPGNIDVFKLNKPTSNGSVSGSPVGQLNLGIAVVGTALSPNGSLLYATSELSGRKATGGSLSVIDVKTLETNPSQGLVSNVSAGCQTVREIVSSDGKTVWATARASNHLLAFDAAKLVSDPDNALVASVQVGTSPVGLTFARNESRILTADSNRFNATNATSGISVVDVDAALSGKSAVLGRIPTGLFPREFAVSRDGGVVLVADYASKQIQAIDVTTLP